MRPDWLEIHRGVEPLIVSFPHTGGQLPADIEPALVSTWLARRDADWWVEKLYDFACDLGATTIRTRMSRTVIDVNRDPSGASLYPGQATTELCPLTTFDGDLLYRDGLGPDDAQIAERRERWFSPYHKALTEEIARLREGQGAVVLYDAHSIRSRIPRLFAGELPHFNVGSNGGQSCAAALRIAVAQACSRSPFSHVVDGRFRGGWTTRHYGQPQAGVHAIQMELACRGYMDEPPGAPTEDAWPPPYDPLRAAPMRAVLKDVLEACLDFAKAHS